MNKKDAFIQVIRGHQGLIFKVASIYTNNDEDKDDLSQEIIYQLWKSFDSFQQKSKLSTWIYRVAMNTAIYYLKIAKRKIRTEPLDTEFLNVHEPGENDAEERWRLFRQSIDRLNLLDKGIVLLYLENKSHEEIAQIIGISTSNVGTKIARIKEKLKQNISKQ